MRVALTRVYWHLTLMFPKYLSDKSYIRQEHRSIACAALYPRSPMVSLCLKVNCSSCIHCLVL
ncbi:hypothetical protein EMIT0194P_340008 [Pseudomonas serbica]